MRPELVYNPRLLIERLAIESVRRRRMARLKRTPAKVLSLGHIDSLELLDLAGKTDIAVIYDIGANVGTWTLLAKAVIPSAQIHAFEPLQRHQDEFRMNVGQLDDVSLHGIALGSQAAATTIRVTEISDSSSILPIAPIGTAYFGTREVDRVPINVESLDEYRRAQRLPWPDLIKLDVQGYELEVLKGGQECLKHAKAVIAEVSFVSFNEGQCLFEDVVRFMSGAGFQLRAFGVNTPIGKPLWQTDTLFGARTSNF